MIRVRNGETILMGEELDHRRFDHALWPYMKSHMLKFKGNVALIEPHSGETYTYERVLSLAESLARGLCKLGLRQGKALCMLTTNSIENALLSLATIASGGVIHGVNPASMPDEVKRQLLLTDAVMVATIPELLPVAKKAVTGTAIKIILIGPRDGHFNFADLLTLGTDDVTLPTTFGDPKETTACLLFSSGTTGLPKGVEITQRNIVSLIEIISVMNADGAQSWHILLVILPFFHVYGLVNNLLMTLCYGQTLVIMKRFVLQEFLAFTEKYKVTTLMIVPPVLVAMVNYPSLSKYDISSVTRVLSGAAALGKEFVDKFLKKVKVPLLLQGYGMTENAVATICTLDQFKTGSCGRPLPCMEIKIVDPDTGRSVGVNEVGELYMRGPITMKGYLKNPKATRETIDDQGWLHSGDIAKMDSDGFVYIVDRRKELIKFKGEQVAPAMLEDLLLGHPGVADVCVIGLPDPVAGELPLAYVVKAKDRADLTENDVKDFVAKNMPSYMRLRGGVRFVDQIPKSPSGKILRRIVRDQLKEELKRSKL